jgi:hypothetical protein
MLDEMRHRRMPGEGHPPAAWPRLSVGPFRFEAPLADKRLEFAERMLCGWLSHRSLLPV